MRHEVKAIDLDARVVEVRALDQDRTIRLGFDQLHIATGARPVRPDLPGIDAPWVRAVQTLADAARLIEQVKVGEAARVVIVGAGYIGLEMAEAFVDRGARVTIVDAADQPMHTMDRDMAALVTEALQRYGIDVRLGTEVQGFEDGKVVTADGPVPADLAVLGLGVRPDSTLADAAGIELGVKGTIRVDRRQRTSVEGVYAAGDCADVHHLVSGERTYVALGTVANKTGRVAGINIGGGQASFPGVIGTAITRICEVEIARTGLNEAEADAAGFPVVTGRVESTTRAGYFPGAGPITIKVVADASTGRLLGGQLVGTDRAGLRIDTLATAITAGLTVAEVVDLDLAYAPPMSPVWDPVQVAARKAVAQLQP